MKKEIKVKLSFRQGEYQQAARLEFPHSWFIIRILEITSPAKQKKYRFHYFNNVLVATNYSDDLLKFLQSAASQLQIKLKFIKT